MLAEMSAALPLLLWVNGRPADPQAPHLSPLDRGFTLADGLFETMRALGGVVFRLRAHMDRLRAGAAALAIELPLDVERHVADAARAAHAAGCGDAALRLTVSRGPGPGGLAILPGATPTVTLVALPSPRFPARAHERGLAVAIASGRRNERAMSAGLKTLGYTDSVMALAEARARGADDALLLDTEEHLSEGAASNLFLVLGKTLATPPLSCGALPGVTRATVLELAASLGVPTVERRLTRRELHAAREVFLTSTLRGIAPVTHVIGAGGDEQPVGDGSPGPVTRRVREAYAELLRRECGG
jgi:branched-chain amino acid aminotransferase